MMESSTPRYYIELYKDGDLLGAGFLLTRCYAVTALHCLQGITPGSDELDISFGNGSNIPGRVHRRCEEADLALIDIPKSQGPILLPSVSNATTGEQWKNPYKPSNHHIHISGKVDKARMAYQTADGSTIEALQLMCLQSVGDYAGYSGSPIERDDFEGSMVLGVLLEQYPERDHYQQGTGRASNVLLAATISEVFRRFDCFAVGHLFNTLMLALNESSEPAYPSAAIIEPEAKQLGAAQDAADVRKLEASIDATRSVLEALNDWQKRGLVDELAVSKVRMRALRRLTDGR